jgi:hypothetical protein
MTDMSSPVDKNGMPPPTYTTVNAGLFYRANTALILEPWNVREQRDGRQAL